MNRSTQRELNEKVSYALLLIQLRTMDEAEQIHVLAKAGFGNVEIAELVGTTTNAVALRLSRERRKAR